MTTTNVPVLVDGAHSVTAALVESATWNGWACPWFTRDQGMTIAQQSAALVERYGEDDCDLVEWDDYSDTFVITRRDWREYVPTRALDGVTLYGIGAGAWTWEVAAAQS